MLVGFDTEYSFGSVRRIDSRWVPDVTTARPVCACLAFEDGREERLAGDWDRLRATLGDDRYTVVTHA